MKNLLSVMLVLLCSLEIFGQRVDSGIKKLTILSDNSCLNNKIILFKYHNIFRQELLQSVTLICDSTFISSKIYNTDVYQIKKTEDGKFKLFIWDKDITIRLNCDKLNESVVINSPLTNEWEFFQKSRIDSLIVPIWKLDSLIKIAENNSYSKSIIVELYEKRNKFMNNNKKLHSVYTENYIRMHLKSFVSLLLLTITGLESDEEKSRILFNELSPDLKNHERAHLFSNH